LKLSFQRVVIHPDWTPNRRVTPFLLCWCKLSQADFRMCDAQRFGCNFLHRYPKMLILAASESRFNGALEIQCFPFCTIGDSPKGPLNNRRKTRLKPAKNAKH
jgi:hypothetical protein